MCDECNNESDYRDDLDFDIPNSYAWIVTTILLVIAIVSFWLVLLKVTT